MILKILNICENHINKLCIDIFIIYNILSWVIVVESWNLNIFGVNETNTPVEHVTVMKNKAYLSIPRKTKHQLITFIEAPWPENSQVTNTPRLFPSQQLQVLGDCDSLQSVICSDVDTAGQLYVLDVGFLQCQPKIVVYDGVQHKKITGFIYDLYDVDGSTLNSMVVDNFVLGGPRAYIGYAAKEGLIVFCFRERHWWFVKLTPPAEIIDFYPQKFRLESQQMTLSKNKQVLYFVPDDSDYLFSITTQALHSSPVAYEDSFENIESEAMEIGVKFEGQMIGLPQGLVCDAHHNLYYFIPRFYVLVRWDTRNRLIAEHHEVIIQSATLLPQVEQIFLDLQSIWMLLGLPNEDGHHCVKIQKS